MIPITYLLITFTWYHPQGPSMAMEAIPQVSAEQCKSNGEDLMKMYKEIKYKCLDGAR